MRKAGTKILSIMVFFMFVAAAAPARALPGRPGEAASVPGEIIARFKQLIPNNARTVLFKALNDQDVREAYRGTFFIIRVPRGLLAHNRAALQNHPAIEHARLNYIHHGHDMGDPPDDPLYPNQWSFEMLNVEPE